MVNIKTLKHCENLLYVSSEIKQYLENTIVKLYEWHWASFPNGNCYKLKKNKDDVIITSYRQIPSHKDISTVAN